MPQQQVISRLPKNVVMLKSTCKRTEEPERAGMTSSRRAPPVLSTCEYRQLTSRGTEVCWCWILASCCHLKPVNVDCSQMHLLKRLTFPRGLGGKPIILCSWWGILWVKGKALEKKGYYTTSCLNPIFLLFSSQK